MIFKLETFNIDFCSAKCVITTCGIMVYVVLAMIVIVYRQAEQRYGAAARHLRGHQKSESRSGIAVFDYCVPHTVLAK